MKPEFQEMSSELTILKWIIASSFSFMHRNPKQKLNMSLWKGFLKINVFICLACKKDSPLKTQSIKERKNVLTENINQGCDCSDFSQNFAFVSVDCY